MWKLLSCVHSMGYYQYTLGIYYHIMIYTAGTAMIHLYWREVTTLLYYLAPLQCTEFLIADWHTYMDCFLHVEECPIIYRIYAFSIAMWQEDIPKDYKQRSRFSSSFITHLHIWHEESEFEFLCCLTTPGFRKDIQRHTRQQCHKEPCCKIQYKLPVTNHCWKGSMFPLKPPLS